MNNINFRLLRADEIEVRVGEKKNGYMSLLLYQDARCAMNILDETLGQFGWACQYKEEKGTLFAGIAIKAEDGTWIWKWDAGAPSNFESQKGESSDAFKRAAVRWGLARELYSAPKIRIQESNATHSVSLITYDENRKIKDLQIVDWNGNVVFNYENGQVVKIPEASRLDVLKAVCGELKKQEGIDIKTLLEFYGYYEDHLDKYDIWNAGFVRSRWNKWKEKAK